MPKLSATALQKAQPGDILYDDLVPGLHAKVGAKRTGFFLYFRTPARQERRPKIGDYGVLTIQQAREIARDWLHKNARGEAIKEVTPNQLRTVQDLYDQWEREHTKQLKPSTVVTMKGQWVNHILPAIGKMRLVDVNRQAVYDLFEDLSEDQPILANRVLGLISKALSLAEQWEWRAPGSNPCRTIPHNKENERKRYLTKDELQRLGQVLKRWDSLGGWEQKVARLVLLLMMTGARKNELAHARKEWIKLDRQILELPDSKTGEKVMVLPTPAVRLIQAMMAENDSPWLFPGKDPSKPICNPNPAWKELKSEAKLENLRLHDLRHSFASIGISVVGVNLEEIGGVIGHADRQSTERYAHLMEDRRIQISENVAAATERLLLGTEAVADTLEASVVG